MNKCIIIIGCVALLAAGCNRTREKETAPASVVVRTANPVLKTYRRPLQYTGSVFAWKEADLGASLPGKVEKMYCREGMHVDKGTLLVELSGELLTEALVENEALKKDYERLQRLGEKGSISLMEIDHLRARYEASQAKVELLRKNTQIVAPFSGTVVDIFVNEGENFSLVPNIDQQNLTLSGGILRLVQLDPLKVKIEVNEKDLLKVVVGREALMTFDSYPGKTYHGRISYVRPVLSASSRSVTAEVQLDNPGGFLRPGMFANVTILLPEEEGLFLPMSAIARQPGTSQDYVFTVKDSRAVRTTVKRLYTLEGMVAVEGVAPGQQVIVSGKGKITEGAIVETQNQQP